MPSKTKTYWECGNQIHTLICGYLGRSISRSSWN